MALLIGVVVVLVLGALALWAVVAYGELLRARNAVDKAWSGVEVLLKQRRDELPRLISTCRSYAGPDAASLARIAEVREALQQAKTPKAKMGADAQLREALGALFASAERNAELRMNTTFRQIQRRLTGLDGAIDQQHRAFEESVALYRRRARRFPGLLLAGLASVQPRILG